MVFSTRTFNFSFLLANAYVLANIGAAAQNGNAQKPGQKIARGHSAALRARSMAGATQQAD
jgi:hypothetical protein